MTDGVSESAQATPEVAQKATEAANPVFELLSMVPMAIWVVLATGIVTAIGWFGKTAFDSWQKSRLPFRQDKERYMEVMAAINPHHLHYLREVPLSSIGKNPLDGLDDASHELDRIQKASPDYLNKKLRAEETELRKALQALCDFLPLKVFPHRMNPNVYTMYWDQFDEWNDEHQKRFAAIKDELTRRLDRAITAFENYRDTGNRMFSDKLLQEKSDG